MTAADLVPADDLAALERLNPADREVAVTRYLTDARDRLAFALEATGPAAVAAIKAEIATAAEATKQLGLSREIQQDAQEMVRRAEYALGKAIRAGQERGEIGSRDNNNGGAREPYTRVRMGVEQTIEPAVRDTNNELQSPKAFFKHGTEAVETYALSDGVSESAFETALSDARAEGNLSRANVVRKVRGVKTDGMTPVERLRTIRDLAPKGYTSQQIADRIGVRPEYVRERAREDGVEIAADKVVGRTLVNRRADSNRIVQETVNTLEGLTIGLRLVNPDDLDPTQAENWAVSLSESIRALNRLVRQIKETTQ